MNEDDWIGLLLEVGRVGVVYWTKESTSSVAGEWEVADIIMDSGEVGAFPSAFYGIVDASSAVGGSGPWHWIQSLRLLT